MPDQTELVGAGVKIGGDGIAETTTAAFRVDVIAQSARQPVLVEFWAPANALCKQIAPALEKVAKAAAGKVVVVKMNIDQHPEIAGQLGIQSIPAVIAFQKGQPVDGFMGALSESQIKGFVERLVGPLGGESDELVLEGDISLAAGDATRAAELYSESLGLEPGNVKAVAGLVRALVALGELEHAASALSSVSEAADIGGILAAARASLELAEQATSIGDFGELEQAIANDPKNHQARFDLALAYNSAGKREEAADSLLEIMRRDRAWNDDAARKQLLQLFEAWGHMEPETMAARRKLSVLLFS